MSKILPITYPIITSYSHHTAILSILGVDESFMPWFCENYIELSIIKDPDCQAVLDFLNLDVYTFHVPRPPLLEFVSFKPEQLKLSGSDFENFVITGLENDYYIYAVLRCAEIPLYRSQRTQRHHPLLIYGYDQQQFYCGDFFENGKFRFEKIHRSFVASAFEQIIPGNYWWSGLKLLKKKKALHSLNAEKIKTSFRNYIAPSYSTVFSHPKLGQLRVGIDDVYNRLLLDLENLELGKRVDRRAIPIFAEHKKAVLRILSYLQQLNRCNVELVERFTVVTERMEMIRNGLLKYHFTKNSSLLQRVREQLMHLRVTEKQILNEVVNVLS
ncbi:hypothetical protein IDH44_19925 [Paenibacillus sp. IB182496]|uniref:Butirosin biosynthesis protein H-like n=1 Tax=Paenibacillus sabuli TaxID=2772509 RepID=A0A927BXV1_9BACL|nr:hypothetical protein [Paenibacillus sabuli]MBD2847474.1 hypothetical protein [Paenibacillus sabuli]